MSAQRNSEAAATKDLPPGAVDLADCGRQVRGFLAAAFVPGALGGVALLLSGDAATITPMNTEALVFWLFAWAVLGAFFGLFVTIPTILVAGLPAYLLYRRLGWTDWPRHLLGGAVIGWIVGVLTSGGLQASKDPASLDLLAWIVAADNSWRLGSVLLGAASVLMLWSILYTRRAWLMFFGLLSTCPLVVWRMS